MKCAHETCVCEVPGGDRFCSDYCRNNIGNTEDLCGCGHPECELHQEKRRMSPGKN